MIATLFAAAVPKVAPNMDALPGGNAVTTLLSWIMGLAIAGCVGIFIFGCARAFAGNKMGNAGYSEDGKKAMIGAPIAALLIIAAPTIIQGFVDLGGTIK